MANADFSFDEAWLILVFEQTGSTRRRAATASSGRVSSVRVPMMNIRKVSMPVHGGFVQMRMGMRLGAVPLECVGMSMVLVMPVRVRVLDCVVNVLVNVMLA